MVSSYCGSSGFNLFLPLEYLDSPLRRSSIVRFWFEESGGTPQVSPLYSRIETGQAICAVGVILVELQIPHRLGSRLVGYFKNLRTFRS